MKKLLPFLIGLSVGSFSILSNAENLLQVYQQARESNPNLKQVAAERDMAYEKINQSRGVLLPQLGVSGSYGTKKGYRGLSDDTQSTSLGGELKLTQILFNMSRWHDLTITEKQAGLSDLSYEAQGQLLILDTATAYFNVLRSIDTLTQISAQKSAIGQQLEQTQQRFNVGLVAITDVHNAQAEYDNTLATEVLAKNELDNAIEELRMITGITYHELSSLDTKRFSMSQAFNPETLIQEAENNNLTLLYARLSQDIAKEQIKLAKDGHLPTLSISGTSDLANSESKRSGIKSGTQQNGDNAISLGINVPIFSGGQTNSLVKQSQHNYISASQKLDSAYREVVKNVRSSYNNIAAAISTVTAYSQSVISAESSLKATRAGYNVGTRTIVDVLNATTALYNAKTRLSNARYDYLISQLNLKNALGTLSEEDLVVLNNDLGEAITSASDR